MLRITFKKKTGNATTGLGTIIRVSSSVGTASLSDLLAIKDACEASAVAADASADISVSKAVEASTSATNAQNSALAASGHADSALASKNAAATSETNALASKNAAATSATTASTQAGIATTKASEASTSATTASTQAGIATTKASEAATSASSALASKNSAATSETNALASADAADVSEANALASKNSAAVSETNAAASASLAEMRMSGRSQSQFESVRDQNKEEFAASGFVHFGQQVLASAVNEGLTTSITVPNNLWIGIHDAAAGRGGKSKTKNPVINIAGTIFYIDRLAQTFEYLSTIKFPQAPDGKTTYNKSTGVNTVHASITAAFAAESADPTNVEVVTDRVDMWGFEAWLEEVNTTNPYVYPNGLIQSQAATMEEIATSTSGRPVTYYAVFDGDTGPQGKGLNYFTLSDANKKKVLGNSKNNLYYLNDGRLVQWRLRQRTIAGAGNGDWVNVNSNSSYSGINFDSKICITAQGFNDYRAAFIPITNGSNSYRTTNTTYNNNPQIGIFTVVSSSSSAINSECYFLVCGTVNHGINQGLYHPSYNAGGAAKAVGDTFWYNTATSITSKADCFDSAKLLAGSGSIASGKSGRPDGRYYDAIYADGQGGVCRDMRYSAYGMDAVDFAEADQKVKNGTYRGFELLKFTRVFSSSSAATTAGYTIQDSSNATAVVATKLSNISVGSSFIQTDVVGNPANILATPQLANGWQGSWVPDIPDGTKDYFTLTRKYTGSGTDVARTYTANNGTSWTSGMILVNAPITNQSQFDNMPANYVVLYQYKAFAKQTENAANAVVYGAYTGIGLIYSSSYYATDTGSLLSESLLNKILTSATNQPLIDTVALTKVKLQPTIKLATSPSWGNTEHNSIVLNTPINSSPAFKALNYNVNINQQAFIQYAYTELKHNGTNWGDDGKVTIVDNQSTKTDLNGNTVLVGTAILKEPIGWIKNKV